MAAAKKWREKCGKTREADGGAGEAQFFRDISAIIVVFASYGGIEPRPLRNGMATAKEIVSQTEPHFQPCQPCTCVQAPSLHRHGDKYNRPVSGTIAVANNQISALSADHPPHPRLSFDRSACSLARSLARAPANTPDCTPSVFKQSRTLPSPPPRPSTIPYRSLPPLVWCPVPPSFPFLSFLFCFSSRCFARDGHFRRAQGRERVRWQNWRLEFMIWVKVFWDFGTEFAFWEFQSGGSELVVRDGV